MLIDYKVTCIILYLSLGFTARGVLLRRNIRLPIGTLPDEVQYSRVRVGCGSKLSRLDVEALEVGGTSEDDDGADAIW